MSATHDAALTFEFSGFTLDVGSRRLIDASGACVSLPPRVFDTLAHLMQQRPSLVGKRELMKAVWGTTIVADNSIDQNISTIRRALAHHGVTTPIIVTEKGRGYRFIGDVAERRTSHDGPAEQLLHDARPLILRPSRSNLQGAFQLLSAAVERRPLFAPALAQLSLLRTLFPLFEMPMSNAYGLAETEANRALKLQPGLAQAHHALAYVAMARARWVEARSHFDSACAAQDELDARVARATLLFQSVGHFRLAEEETRGILRAHPLLPLGLLAHAASLVYTGDDAAAAAAVERVASIGWPAGQTPLAEFRFLLHVRSRRFRQAAASGIEGFGTRLRAFGVDETVTLVCAALELASQAPAATAAIRALIGRASVAGLGLRSQKRLLVWLTMLGALDDAFALLWKSLEDPAAQGTIRGPWTWLWLPEMKPFRRDARFPAVAERLGLPDYWARFGPPDDSLA